MEQEPKTDTIVIVKESGLRAALAEILPRFLGTEIMFREDWPKGGLSGETVAIFDHEAAEMPDTDKVLCLMVGGATAGATEALPRQNLFPAPLHVGLLLDRINRHRTHALRGSARGAVISFGPYQLASDDTILRRAGRDDVIRLTEKERDILLLLHDLGGDVERSVLLESIWGYGSAIETHTLETHIYRLRQKIEDNPAEPQWLVTAGAGYRLEV